MRLLALAITVLFLAAVIDGGLRQFEADRAHNAAVGDCLVRPHKTVAQCEEAP